MNRICITFSLFFVFTFFSQAQKFTIQKTIQPFYDIIEWRGMGALLMSKDPSGNNNQIYLTLISNSDKSIWEQQIAPPKGKYYFISSENAKYVYFMRNLVPESGKVYFDQLNEAGNVKNTNVSFTSAFKNLGLNIYGDVELVNVVVTDKALVHHFRVFNKSEDSYTEVATFITHHNMLDYAVKLGTYQTKDLKEGKVSHYHYIGFSDDGICFANHGVSPKFSGWNVLKFNEKGKILTQYSIKDLPFDASPINQLSFGANAAFYMGKSFEEQSGILNYLNGNYYLSVVRNVSNKPTLELYQLIENEWKLANSSAFTNLKAKKVLGIGTLPLNEAMCYQIEGFDGGNRTLTLYFDGKTKILKTSNHLEVYNPSRMLVSDVKIDFAVSLAKRNLFFDKSQLGKLEDVIFEYKTK